VNDGRNARKIGSHVMFESVLTDVAKQILQTWDLDHSRSAGGSGRQRGPLARLLHQGFGECRRLIHCDEQPEWVFEDLRGEIGFTPRVSGSDPASGLEHNFSDMSA